MEHLDYYNMLICHAVATGYELSFMKILKKIGYLLKADPDNQRAKKTFNMFYDKPFVDVQNIYTKAFRELLSESLQLSVKRQRETIAFDLLDYAASKFFALKITDKEIDIMVFYEMHTLIDKMVAYNTMLEMDQKQMNVDELFQAQMAAQRQERTMNNLGKGDDFEGGSKQKESGKNTQRDNTHKDLDNLLLDM